MELFVPQVPNFYAAHGSLPQYGRRFSAELPPLHPHVWPWSTPTPTPRCSVIDVFCDSPWCERAGNLNGKNAFKNAQYHHQHLIRAVCVTLCDSAWWVDRESRMPEKNSFCWWISSQSSLCVWWFCMEDSTSVSASLQPSLAQNWHRDNILDNGPEKGRDLTLRSQHFWLNDERALLFRLGFQVEPAFKGPLHQNNASHIKTRQSERGSTSQNWRKAQRRGKDPMLTDHRMQSSQTAELSQGLLLLNTKRIWKQFFRYCWACDVELKEKASHVGSTVVFHWQFTARECGSTESWTQDEEAVHLQVLREALHQVLQPADPRAHAHRRKVRPVVWQKRNIFAHSHKCATKESATIEKIRFCLFIFPRPFACETCGRAFRRKDHLRDHRYIRNLCVLQFCVAHEDDACHPWNLIAARKQKSRVQTAVIVTWWAAVINKIDDKRSLGVAPLSLYSAQRNTRNDCFKQTTISCLFLFCRFVHSQERPFKCSTCSKQFCQKRTMKVHEDSHRQVSSVDTRLIPSERYLVWSICVSCGLNTFQPQEPFSIEAAGRSCVNSLAPAIFYCEAPKCRMHTMCVKIPWRMNAVCWRCTCSHSQCSFCCCFRRDPTPVTSAAHRLTKDSNFAHTDACTSE